MSSQAQIDANRLNAQKSSGPATGEGKEKSRFNAFKHGAYASHPALTREDPESFAARVEQYRLHFSPQNVEENFHVEAMIAAHEETERVTLLETLAFAAAVASVPEDSGNPLGEALVADYKGPRILEKLSRRRSAAHSQWVRSNKLFKQLRNPAPQPEPAPAQPVAAPAPPPAAPRPASGGPQPVPSQASPRTQPQSPPDSSPKKGGFTGNEPPAWRL